MAYKIHPSMNKLKVGADAGGAPKSGMSERLQTRVARATGPCRPATRRTERVRRSICLQHLSRSVNAKSMAFFFFQHGGANPRPERPPQDSPGQRPGFAATVAIKRCKRATILLLTRRYSNVVAQASQPAVSQVSKPACRVVSTTHPNLLAPSFHGVIHVCFQMAMKYLG